MQGRLLLPAKTVAMIGLLAEEILIHVNFVRSRCSQAGDTQNHDITD